MEEYKRGIGISIGRLQAENAETPKSSEELETFCIILSQRIVPILKNASQKIRDLTHSSFAIAGYDSIIHKAKKNCLLSYEGVENAMKEIQHGLENAIPSITPNPAELSDFSLACGKLWDLDVNRLVPDVNYRVNIQHGKSAWGAEDVAYEPFFSDVDHKYFELPTFKWFICLLNNYSAVEGTAEVVTSEEKAEEAHFLSAVLETPCGLYLHKYLVAKGKAPADKASFRTLLHDTWFGLYRREKENDSSGFEHVFTGEISHEAEGLKVSGLHNWIQLYLEEKAGRLDYQGFIKPKRNAVGISNSSTMQQFINLQFKWGPQGQPPCLKPESSSFIGVSPEFELAIYSLAFFLGKEKDVVQVGPYKVGITVYNFTSRGKRYIGSAFPEMPRESNSQSHDNSRPDLNPGDAATIVQRQFRQSSSSGKR
jgi:poly(U)-specific endoribonuclease